MKKSELIAAVASTADVSKADAERVLDAFTGVARTALSEGKKVPLTDFGTFVTKERAARAGRNPQTGQPLTVPAKTVAQFKPAKSLADHLA
ncbi:HU family DNA-binding protein [Leisingera sp. MMG025]|nr:HU family DNA-binding protein [Leisingera sp. MMG026]